MNFANRTYKLPLPFTGVVNSVLAIILILGTLGVSISRFGTTVGIFVGLVGGGALTAAVCSILILLLNIQNVLEESRAIGSDSEPQGETLEGKIGSVVG
ncbi:MAG: hypothetical protein OXU26_14400 [Acidobacteriota bacterium]|nr:hypothetical protein [Acidobacteriota bacterium]MDE2965096.1 hypothetical protein [Acidobacteriota bacterium]